MDEWTEDFFRYAPKVTRRFGATIVIWQGDNVWINGHYTYEMILPRPANTNRMGTVSLTET